MKLKYIEDLQNGLKACIEQHSALLIGEDIAEPYGGAFKVTKPLTQSYPQNFLQTPMSEQGFCGFGIGYALQGGYAVVEIMFGDFITLCSDQLINHAAKLHDLYGEKLHFVLRTPSGGYRGYGATHSQSLERLFVGVPGLQVKAPSMFHQPGTMLKNVLESGIPTLFIENKLDYARDLYEKSPTDIYTATTAFGGELVSIEVEEEQPEVTILTYGGMAAVAVKALEMLMLDEEVAVQVLVLGDLNPAQVQLQSHIKADKVLALEEGWDMHGVGSGWLTMLPDKVGTTMGARQHSIYSGRVLESAVLPQESDIIKAVMEMVS